MVGMLLEAQGKRDEARKWYRGHGERHAGRPGGSKQPRLHLRRARREPRHHAPARHSAKQRIPDDPDVDDTIGWIYYKKDLPSLAIKPLEESLRKRPDNAEVPYHLGLSHAKLGNNAKARETLTAALKLDPNVGGGEAKRALASVPQENACPVQTERG